MDADRLKFLTASLRFVCLFQSQSEKETFFGRQDAERGVDQRGADGQAEGPQLPVPAGHAVHPRCSPQEACATRRRKEEEQRTK